MLNPLNRNLVSRRIGDLLILVQNAEIPRDDEWSECLSMLSDTDNIDNTRVLVFSKGGAPSVPQRRQLERILGGTKVRSAVVSDSVKIRFIVSTVALFSSKISSFQVKELAQAFEYLKLNTGERRRVETAIQEMSKQLS